MTDPHATGSSAATRYKNADRHCLVVDTDAPHWTYHRPLYGRELAERGLEGGMGWMTACGLQMWSGRFGRGRGCMGNRNVIEHVAKPCGRCYPELRDA